MAFYLTHTLIRFDGENLISSTFKYLISIVYTKSFILAMNESNHAEESERDSSDDQKE